MLYCKNEKCKEYRTGIPHNCLNWESNLSRECGFINATKSDATVVSSDEVERNGKDGTEALCQALYGRKAEVKDWIGGSNANMLFDAADRILSLTEAGQNNKFEKPKISHDEYINWIHKNLFLASEEGMSLSRRILENYINSVEQFINDPNSMAAKRVFEIATQTVKKYISCF